MSETAEILIAIIAGVIMLVMMHHLITQQHERKKHMYETPKAIHFLVKENGKEINTEEALALKWSVAKGLGSLDMLRLTDNQLKAIARACNKLNQGMLSKIGFTVELRDLQQ